jgi:hypothetical protein
MKCTLKLILLFHNQKLQLPETISELPGTCLLLLILAVVIFFNIISFMLGVNIMGASYFVSTPFYFIFN